MFLETNEEIHTTLYPCFSKKQGRKDKKHKEKRVNITQKYASLSVAPHLFFYGYLLFGVDGVQRIAPHLPDTGGEARIVFVVCDLQAGEEAVPDSPKSLSEAESR